MTDVIKVEIKGAKELEKAIKRFPVEAKKYLGQAGKEAADRVVLKTPGLGGAGEKTYPPGGPGAPQAPYWTDKQRRFFFAALRDGRIEVPYRRGGTGSERYGTQWYTEPVEYGTKIGNRTRYGHWLGGEDQSQYMANRGWRKLKEATEEQLDKITKVYQAWVDKLIRAVGL